VEVRVLSWAPTTHEKVSVTKVAGAFFMVSPACVVCLSVCQIDFAFDKATHISALQQHNSPLSRLTLMGAVNGFARLTPLR
jgi:hypothetical protein